MHENREISSAPCSDDQGRSAKAKSRAADMHVLEKSDCAVVPVNQPNKGGGPSAKAGEGRAQTRENIVQSRMHPTRSGKRMSRGWTVCGRQQGKESRSGSLLCSTTSALIYALQRKASPGVDGITWQEYESGLEDRLVDLHSRVHRGAYRAKPSSRVFIPKADGRQRPLGIAALEDKIVPQAVVAILNQISLLSGENCVKWVQAADPQRDRWVFGRERFEIASPKMELGGSGGSGNNAG